MCTKKDRIGGGGDDEPLKVGQGQNPLNCSRRRSSRDTSADGDARMFTNETRASYDRHPDSEALEILAT